MRDSSNRIPRISRRFPAFPWKGVLGFRIAFSGEDEVDMLGYGHLGVFNERWLKICL